MLPSVASRPLRAAVPTLCAALLAGHAHAVTLRVGLDAGQPGSTCEHRIPQHAINALPNDGQIHRIELQADRYLDADAAILVDGKQIEIVTVYARGSSCRTPGSERAELIASNTGLDGGRTIVARNGGRLRLERVSVTSNMAGGLLLRNGFVQLVDSVVSHHRSPAGASGAGVVIEGGALEVHDSELADNAAGANGGAIFCSAHNGLDASVTVSGDSRFIANRARLGGAFYLFRGCQLALEDDPELRANVASFDGGAIATEPQAGGLPDRNEVLLRAGGRFHDNAADRDGGAVHVTAGNRLFALTGTRQSWAGNTAGRNGGALYVSGAGPIAVLSNGRFQDNVAGEAGGAIAVRGRPMALRADCEDNVASEDGYCAMFDANAVPTPAPDSGAARRGGAVHVDGEAVLSIDGYAFRHSREPATSNGGSGGAIVAVDVGHLHLASSLVFDSEPDPAFHTNLLLIRAGGTATLSFNTLVDAPSGTTLFIHPGGSAHLIGNIIAGNAVGVVNGGGLLRGTCNNAQLGAEPPPRDPGFLTTPDGRYRLAPDSPMRDRGLTCDPDALPAGFQPPQLDLLGRQRITTGEEPMAIDLGAIEFRASDDAIFDHGFEGPLP